MSRTNPETGNPILRVIVTGGRNYPDRNAVLRELNALCGNITQDTPLGTIELEIVHGDCRKGVDRFADDWAVVNWARCERFPADWDNLETPGARVIVRPNGTKYNAQAGPDRNQKMVDAGADLCLAFPGNEGTADMIRRALRAGIEVRKVGGWLRR